MRTADRGKRSSNTNKHRLTRQTSDASTSSRNASRTARQSKPKIVNERLGEGRISSADRQIQESWTPIQTESTIMITDPSQFDDAAHVSISHPDIGQPDLPDAAPIVELPSKADPSTDDSKLPDCQDSTTGLSKPTSPGCASEKVPMPPGFVDDTAEYIEAQAQARAQARRQEKQIQEVINTTNNVAPFIRSGMGEIQAL